MIAALPAIDPAATYKAKAFVAGTALMALGVCFEFLSEHCPAMQEEIADWEQGRCFAMGIMPNGPAIAVRKEGAKLTYLGRGDHGAPIKILFKNVDGALLVLTGQIAAYTAFAESRAIVHGPLDVVVEANRAMGLVVKFLFPAILLKSLTKRMPDFSRADLLLKARLYAMLVPLIAKNFAK